MSSNNNGSKIGVCTILFLIFLTLKLAEVGAVAHWSWWWVTCPLWIPPTLIVALLLLVVFVFAMLTFVKRLLK